MQKALLPRLIGSAAGLGLMAGLAVAQDQSVEVLHWWTSGGEAAALNVLKEKLEGEGVSWQDMPVAGGGGEQAMTVLRSRATSGNPPTAAQMLGYDIQDWAQLGVVGDMSALAEEEGWNDVVPAALQRFSKYEDKWIAAPVNVHSTNWVWANKQIFDELGLAPPTSWDELIAALDKIKAAGKTPIAYGGQPWQDATVFEAVVISTGGPEFYKKALNDFDPEALTSETMVKAFENYGKLKDYVDPNNAGRDWNLATAMVMNGEAAMQFMGDWAKGEFINAGKVPNQDFLCFRFPGTQGTVPFNADQFVMFQVGEDKADAQNKLASAILSPEFQIAFNKVKGSVPARTDIEAAEFDECAQKGMTDLAEAAEAGTLYGSLAHGHGAPAAVKNAVYDVVTRFWNGEIADAQSAAQELSDAVAAAQ